MSLTIAALFFAFKALVASGLGYTADLFNFLVMSKSFWLGRPWYYENGRGYGSYLHNNFIVPLLGTFTFPFGMYGIIFLLALSLGGASLAIESVAQSIQDSRTKWIRGLNLAVLLGPVTFWVLDNPTYGFHPELFYIPFAALHAVARINSSRLSMLTAIAICLVRQDGPIVVCTVELLFLAFRNPSLLFFVRNSWLHAAKLICFWCFVFFAGLWILSHFGAPGQARIKQALDHFPELFTASTTLSVTLTMLWHCSLFLFSGLLVAALFSPLRTLQSLPFLLPTFGICLIASFAYLPDGPTTLMHGMTWNPRMAIVWSIVVPMALFIVKFGPVVSGVRSKSSFICGICAVSIVIQSLILWHVRSYDVVGRIFEVATGNTPIASLSTVERNFLDCVASALPSSTAIAVHGSLVGTFHRFDIIFPNWIQNAWTFPEVVVCESESRLPFEYQCNASLESIVASHSYVSKSIEGIRVAFSERLQAKLVQCTN